MAIHLTKNEFTVYLARYAGMITRFFRLQHFFLSATIHAENKQMPL